MKVRILGAGTSSGVPRIGNDWGECDPAEPKNRRSRAGFLIETATTRILIDTSPDLREQLLAADVSTVDAVIWTHDHADHSHGIDDLRQVYHALGRPVTGYANSETLASLKARFGYVFDGRDGYPPSATIDVLPPAITIGDIAVTSVPQQHGRIASIGLRFDAEGGAIGIATDFNVMTDEMRSLYTGLDIWVIDALRRRPHPTHPNLDDALRWIKELAPRRALLVHMDQSMDYAGLVDELPPGVEPGWDGLELTT